MSTVTSFFNKLFSIIFTLILYIINLRYLMSLTFAKNCCKLITDTCLITSDYDNQLHFKYLLMPPIVIGKFEREIITWIWIMSKV